MENEKFTVLDFQKKKENGEKITMLTAYDYPMAISVDSSGIDSILVGDSLGMVMLGYDSTVSVTMDEMIHHSKAVTRGAKRSFVIGDMPFMSYQICDEDAIRNAGRFIKEAGCEAVKIEGGEEVVPRVKAITGAGIAVLGHIGLTPQSISKLGGYKVQGKEQESAKRLMRDAIELEANGCFAVVLECVPKELAKEITRELKIPTIGIGAGVGCDGQVLVTHDLIGYFDRFVPKFIKRYANINEEIKRAIGSFKEETEKSIFPDDSHSFE
jgi:3-methyl-2-oxobutanoate hydroxymethyltransferase